MNPTAIPISARSGQGLPQLAAAVNKTRTKLPIDPRFAHLLTELYEPDVVRLAARYPQIDLGLWPNFSYLVRS